MPKSAVSVTLSDANLSWLRGRAVALKSRSLSDTLDTIVTQARTGGDSAAARSVVGTIDIADEDPDLADADAFVRQLVAGALARPFPAARTVPRRASRKRRRG